MSNNTSFTNDSLSQDPPGSVYSRSKRIKQVSNAVWNEYSSWSQKYCQQTIQSLASPTSQHPDSEMANKRSKKLRTFALSGSSDICTISDYVNGIRCSIDDYNVRTQTISAENLAIEKATPYPPYHSCTSISQNILVGDDSDYLPFIPFADDENYDFSHDFELHHYNAWQKQCLDFDGVKPYMWFETTLRLLSDGEMSVEEIDESSLLPLECQEILQFPKKCDIPKSFPFQGTMDRPQIHRKHTPTSTVGYFLEYFCSNLNCTTGFCAMHDGEAVEAQVPKYVTPKTLSTRSTTKARAECGPLCASHPLTSDSVGSNWTPQDCENLMIALRYAPDASSCDLAIICGKACHEIQNRRKELAPPAVRTRANKTRQPAQPKSRSFQTCLADTMGHASPHPRANAIKTRATVTLDVDATKVAHGDGRVAPVPSRVRFAEQKNALVIEHTSNAILTYAFPVDQDETHNLCKNTGIQRGAFKETEVRESKWGLGLFLSEDCEEGDLLSEYVGEMIGPLTVESRNVRAEYRQRSYVFQLNPTYALDSVYAGNTSRYMNHSADSSNCHTRVMFINGEHRIGIYAARRMSKGEELLIDYGTDFWEPKEGETPIDADPSPPPATFEDPKDLTYNPSGDGNVNE